MAKDNRLSEIRRELDFIGQTPTDDLAELQRRSQRLAELRTEMESIINKED